MGNRTLAGSTILAQYAFKGPKEQRLSLSVPIHYQKHLGGEHTPVIATVEAQIISKPAQEVRIPTRHGS